MQGAKWAIEMSNKHLDREMCDRYLDEEIELENVKENEFEYWKNEQYLSAFIFSAKQVSMAKNKNEAKFKIFSPCWRLPVEIPTQKNESVFPKINKFRYKKNQ